MGMILVLVNKYVIVFKYISFDEKAANNFDKN